MINQDDVNKEEERLRIEISKLSEENRLIFYSKIKHEIKDPDTYATLNWFFLAGLHHFYLKKWLRGFVNFLLFTVGILLIISGFVSYGWSVVFFILFIELWALFRSQVIVQDWNNKLYQDTLSMLKV